MSDVKTEVYEVYAWLYILTMISETGNAGTDREKEDSYDICNGGYSRKLQEVRKHVKADQLIG